MKDAPEDDSDPVVSLVIFEWRDEHLFGVYPSGSTKKKFICNEENVKADLCTEEELGSFILSKNATAEATNLIISRAIHLRSPKPFIYSIKNTGYYCVGTSGYSVQEYKAVVEFRNAYGELPAAQIAKLPFYGGLAITYAVVGAFWAFLYVQNRHDVLPVQNYITAIIVFLIVEQLLTWGFYDYQNRHGFDAVAKVWLVIVSILNAGRNSFSFFLLLIVCMGYGVVKPTLGKTMIYVRFLALAHFAFGVIYAVASLSITPDNAGPLVLLVILPLAATLTAFYVWTLNSLNLTMKDLLHRKQTVKAMMYKKLWWCVLGSIMVIFGFFFVNSFTFAGRSDPDFVPDHWQTRWFILDGWLNLVYFFDIAFVAYLWRPTANNRRFAMSDEIAQDDEGFEIASFGGSLDEEDGDATSPTEPQAPNGGTHRPLSPVPPKPVSETQRPRQSLDGETMFAVGDDADKWSDDEDSPQNSMERQKLTGKND
ncbi:integral membrane protein [Lasallia pustulata]|uniref:Integral membrane protein n=1 Tax=Lasallia pustulata TaxID=136370 RepID=A0A1W5D1A1_9LECA|nr:integral membrane protein [Lasallia pustulata]